VCTKVNSSQSLLWAGGPIIILWTKTVMGETAQKECVGDEDELFER
jgi:hypothetical protein